VKLVPRALLAPLAKISRVIPHVSAAIRAPVSSVLSAAADATAAAIHAAVDPIAVAAGPIPAVAGLTAVVVQAEVRASNGVPAAARVMIAAVVPVAIPVHRAVLNSSLKC
jgi:hypothetical protein